MNATTTRHLIEQARANGVRIVVEAGRVKLRGHAQAVARWSEELRPYKAAILAAAPANQYQRPAVLHRADRLGDAAEFALELLSWFHSIGVILDDTDGMLTPYGMAALPDPLAEEVRILLTLYRHALQVALEKQLLTRRTPRNAAGIEHA